LPTSGSQQRSALELLSAVVPSSHFLLLFHKNSRKQRQYSQHLAVLSLSEPPAAQDFCGYEVSMADNLLQRTAKAAVP